jgi:hypothetical protein
MINPASFSVGVILGHIAGPAAGGLSRGTSALFNRGNTNQLPGVESIIHAYSTGFLSDELFTFGCRAHGVPLLNGPFKEDDGVSTERFVAYRHLWEAVFQSSYSVPSIETAVHGWQRGMIGNGAFDALMARNRADRKFWTMAAPVFLEWLGPQQISQAYNRGILTTDQFEQGIRKQGLLHSGQDIVIDKLRYSLPQSVELTQFAARGVWDTSYTDLTQAYSEMPAGLTTLFAASGFGKVTDGHNLGNADLDGRLWSEIAWAGHWSTLGLGFVNEAYHRLRPGRNNRYAEDGLTPNAFTIDDATMFAGKNGIPPGMRDAALAIGFRPIDRRALFWGYSSGDMPRTEAIDILRDNGLATVDANRYVQLLDARIDYGNAAPVRALEKGIVARTYRSGSEAYKVGTLTRTQYVTLLTTIGISLDAADTYADAIDSDIRTKKVERVLNAIKRDYLNGTMSQIDVLSTLPQTGISSERANDYVQEWSALRTLERRTASTEKIIAWLVKGLIPYQTALARLTNLGWSDPEAILYLAEAQLAIDKRNASIQAAAFRTAKSNAALIDKMLKDAQKQVKELQTELKRLTPVGRLIKWARQGTISAEYFSNRLSAMGFPDDIIAEYWQEVLKDGPLPASGKASKPVPSQPTGLADGGTSTPTSGPAQGVAQQSEQVAKL